MWVKTSIIGLVAVAVLTGCSGQSQAYAPLHNVCKATAGLELQKGPEQGNRLVQEIQGELAVAEAASSEEAAPFLSELEKLKTLNSDKATFYDGLEEFQKMAMGLLRDQGLGSSDAEVEADLAEERAEVADVASAVIEEQRDHAVRGDLLEDRFESLCTDYLAPSN
jgi:hypothetical protein